MELLSILVGIAGGVDEVDILDWCSYSSRYWSEGVAVVCHNDVFIIEAEHVVFAIADTASSGAS